MSLKSKGAPASLEVADGPNFESVELENKSFLPKYGPWVQILTK